MTIKQQGGVFGRNPTFNNVEIDGTGTVDGDLTVNGFSYFNDRLTVTDDHVRVKRSANTSYVNIGVDATSAYLQSTYSSGGTSDLRFLRNSSEIMRITGNGITFNGDTAAANALDDYEEGTYTVSLHDGSSGGNTSATTTTGYYTKVGRVVTCSFAALSNISTAGLTSTSVLYMSLPFSAAQSASGSMVVSVVDARQVLGQGYVVPSVAAGNSRARFFGCQSGNAEASIRPAELTSGTSDFVNFTMTYIAS